VTWNLDRKRVIVTAAASGIGRAIAGAFMDAGARVHVCDLDAELLRAFSKERPDAGVTQTDVADPVQVDQLFDEALDRLGGLDVLVNNAGIAGPIGPIESIPVEEWRRTLSVNLDGQFYCIRRAVPVLKRQGGGAIVNIASTAGVLGSPLRAPYAASKWAVVGLTKSLAIELGQNGIRANAVCPGCVSGDRMERVIGAEAEARGVSPDEVREGYLELSSMRTFVSPSDVANMVLFVCSDAGARISGQALCVDGHSESLTGRDRRETPS
jgi:NAD(P)-dependent dehydrogenase (short-subunit alcohol dehydrogenase family)